MSFCLSFSSIIYSITLSFTLKGANSSSPNDFIAILIISFSLIPNDLFCFLRKNLPASTKTLFGTRPTNSDPVTLKPLLVAC